MAKNDTSKIDGIVNFNTLTPAQQVLVKKTLELERQYGKGNIFLRYIPQKRGIQFIVHYYGMQDFKTIGCNTINQRIIHSLEKKGLAIRCDMMHKEITDINTIKGMANASYLGVLICTECVNWWDIK